MNAVFLLMGVFFVAGAVGIVAGSRFASEFFHYYHKYFITRIGPQLKTNFIKADVFLLFVSSLVFTGVLTASGYLVMGPVGVVTGAVLGLLLPHFALVVIKKRRADQFIFQLPDALHALSSSLRSGINLPKGLEQLAAWQPTPLSQEFGLVLSEYQIGRELGEALDNMHERIPRPELELMNGAIKISRSVGGNLADTLESLAVTLTEKLSVEGKIKALTAMGKMQGWVVSLVPVCVGMALYAMDPGKFTPLFTEVRGWVTLAVIFIMMAMAIAMIRKIVNIDV